MNLAALFGDDEHTASEDSYTRAMKCRKWLVLAAAAFYLTHTGGFAPATFSVLVGSLTLELRLWQSLTTAGLVYSAIQFFLLIIQLGPRYPATLAQRFGLRQAEKAKNAAAELDAVIRQIEDLDGIRSASAAMASVSPEMRERRRQELNRRAEKLQGIVEEAPATEHPGFLYGFAEVLIDIMRLGTPWAAFVVAVVSRP